MLDFIRTGLSQNISSFEWESKAECDLKFIDEFSLGSVNFQILNNPLQKAFKFAL